MIAIADVEIAVGDKFYFGNQLWHIRGFIDDRVVMRRWLKKKQEWLYQCEPIEWFDPKYGFYKKK